MGEYIFKAIVSTILPALLTGMGVYIKAIRMRHKELEARHDAYEGAIRALSHDAFFRYCRYLLPKDDITEEEFENLEHLYRSYHALGMNGTGDKMWEQCKDKPIKKTN